MQGETKNHLTKFFLLDKVVFGYIQIYRQEPCAGVVPCNPRLQASRKRSLKALFASLFLPRVWAVLRLGEGGPRFLETSEMDANMEPKTECSAKICSLYKSWKYYIYSIHTIFFQIWSNLASTWILRQTKKYHTIVLWHCACDETQTYLVLCIYNIMTLIGNP